MAELEHSFTRDRDDAHAIQESLNPLPRSVIQRDGRTYELLDGEWRFDFDAEDRGMQDYWFLEHAYRDTAVWPGTIEDHLAAARGAQQRIPSTPDSVIAWYEREFTIPAAWRGEPACLIQLTFGA